MTCRDYTEHAAPCGPVNDPEACACGCRADDVFCLQDYCRYHDLFDCPYAHKEA